jgi:5-methylcytosine-specific restriction protein A
VPTRPPVHQPTYSPGGGATEYDARRGSAASRGYGHRWRKARAAFLAEHPVCAHPSCAQPAADVDHKIPHGGNYQLMWDQSNWQPLCHPHHSAKTRIENQGR